LLAGFILSTFKEAVSEPVACHASTIYACASRGSFSWREVLLFYDDFVVDDSYELLACAFLFSKLF